jgi:hypothetical protein
MAHNGPQTEYEVLPNRSAVLVRARSNVGPISFATSQVMGIISMVVTGSAIDTGNGIVARLSIPLNALTSGNNLYDTEIRRRIDARRHPSATLELRTAERQAETNNYALTGEMEFHSVTRTISGSVSVDFPGEGMVVVRGQQTFDIRDFDLEPPNALALKIYPDVSVEMHIEAQAS